MSGKQLALGTWTIIVIGILVVAGITFTEDQVYTGTDISFETGRTLQIEAETVTFQAVSSEFFVLRKESGETVVGVPAPPPLGWPSDKYFAAEPQVIPGGTWLFPLGQATVNITSEEPVTINAIEPDPFSIWFGFGLVAALLWLLGIIIAL